MPRRWWALVAVALVTFMTYIDSKGMCSNVVGSGHEVAVSGEVEPGSCRPDRH
jgi:hypothetical protein